MKTITLYLHQNGDPVTMQREGYSWGLNETDSIEQGEFEIPENIQDKTEISEDMTGCKQVYIDGEYVSIITLPNGVPVLAGLSPDGIKLKRVRMEE